MKKILDWDSNPGHLFNLTSLISPSPKTHISRHWPLGTTFSSYLTFHGAVLFASVLFVVFTINVHSITHWYHCTKQYIHMVDLASLDSVPWRMWAVNWSVGGNALHAWLFNRRFDCIKASVSWTQSVSALIGLYKHRHPEIIVACITQTTV